MQYIKHDSVMEDLGHATHSVIKGLVENTCTKYKPIYWYTQRVIFHMNDYR